MNLVVKNLKFFFFFICSLFLTAGYSQLPDFNLQVTATNETCSGNGTLAFVTSGTAPGATLVFAVFKLPNTTNPVATQNAVTLSGLTAGNYRVRATQTLGSASSSQEREATILNLITPLTYVLSGTNGACQNGSITVTVQTGNAVSYQLLSGPITTAEQSSNVFNNLPAGVYQIRVYDSCGEGWVQNYTIPGSTPGMTIGAGIFPNAKLPDCNSITLQNQLTAPTGTLIAYPINLEYTIFPPAGGTPIVLTQMVLSGPPNGIPVAMIIPFYAGQLYTYNLKITDGCNITYVRNNNEIDRNLTVTLSSPTKECSKALNITPNNYGSPITQVEFLTAPAGFNPLTFNGNHPGPFSEAPQYYNSNVPLPEGLYVVQITDNCGRTATAEIQFSQNITLFPLSFNNRKGCGSDSGSVLLSSLNGSLVTATITSAPTAYPVALPHNVSFNIAGNGNFFMNSLPVGSYTFATVDSCGNAMVTTVNIQGEQATSNAVTITENCASFNLILNHVSNVANQSEQFWLQKLDTQTNQWGHPQTGFSNGQIPSPNNALLLNNNATNINLAFSGSFRIMKTFDIYNNGEVFVMTCEKQVSTFEFTGGPKIEAVYSFSCAADLSDVIVIASGLGTLKYRIVTKNGLPFVVENGTNNLFAGLEPGIYGFQVEDSCQNQIGRLFDVTVPLALSITPVNLCDGQNGSLSVPDLSFLNFEWWKGNDTSNILSTSNILAFSPFNAVANSGQYYVRITYPNSNSCIDQVLTFTISSGLSSPNAGTGTAVSYCGSQGNIDLFSLLSGTFDAFGNWEEITSSGNLANNIWDSNVAPGDYEFKYTVNGLCNVVDEATVTVKIQFQPETPVAFLEQLICETQDLQLSATTIANVTYEWTGPNNFSSNEQNPVINNATAANNGTYTVRAITPGAVSCPSETTSVEVNIAITPEFALESKCVNNVFTITAVPVNDSFDPNEVVYSWTGPNNYTSNTNPITITGLASGMYELTIASADCSSTVNIPIGATTCRIPKGVSVNGDGDNDTFNLSGFDIDNLKIFNRYGMVVYERANYISEWNGQDYLGNDLPSATYYYLMRLNSGEAKSGWVYLIREN